MPGQLPSQLIPFLGVVGVITLMPGPDTALVVRNVLRHDLKAGLATALGSCVGLLVWGVAAAVGISALFKLSTVSFLVLRYAGAAYLCYLGVRLLWRAKMDRGVVLGCSEKSARPETRKSVFAQGLLTDLLNPKAATFFSALLPQFISPPRDPVFSTTLLFAGLAAAAALLGLACYATVAYRARAILARRRALRLLDAITGGAFVAIAGRLAFKKN